MSNINTVTASGNLTADPEIKYAGAEGDFAIVNLRMANNRRKKQGDEYVDEVSYFDVTVFGKFGELCDSKLRKGNPITVTGRLEQQRWETQEGDKRSKVVIIASEIDAQAFYLKPEDVTPKENGSGDTKPATSGQAGAKPATADDDIPF